MNKLSFTLTFQAVFEVQLQQGPKSIYHLVAHLDVQDDSLTQHFLPHVQEHNECLVKLQQS